MSMTLRLVLPLAGVAALTAIGLAACSRRSLPPRPATLDSAQIGYGAQPQAKVTGAVSMLSQDQITGRPRSIEELLRGRVPGLEVIPQGNGVTFRIRSTGSMLADQEPLVVVDGMMIQAGNTANALAGLTPDDIKRVDVLKDVASTSIYGGRGAGGVIVITTKRKSPNEAGQT
ncbi:MAG: TonB-dependent receptor plug domain-containing protein [bacterium]